MTKPDHQPLRPGTGAAHELTRYPSQSALWNWGLSPDGTTIAVTKAGDERILLFSLAGEAPRELQLKGLKTVTRWIGRRIPKGCSFPAIPAVEE